jgi:hypothetical protein
MKKFARLGLSLLLVSVSLYAYAALVVSAATDPADEAMTQIRPEAIRADMRFFADDLLEGRGVERRDPGAENKPVTARTFINFRGPEGPTRHYKRAPVWSRFDRSHHYVQLGRKGRQQIGCT